jgi:PLP dependent protein
VGEDARLEELRGNLRAVRERLDAACRAAERDPGEVAVVAVTKTYPADDVVRLARLGITDIGENRDQEAAPKATEVAAAGATVRWHFVGQLQRNKCRSVVTYAGMVQSVDSVRLAVALDEAVHRHREGPLDVLVQVSLDGDTSRGGAAPTAEAEDVQLDHVLAAVDGAEGLRLRGLMAVAPLEWEAERAFADLARVAERVRASYPDATVLSAGMSSDVEQAIRYGATLVRLGTALLGNRAHLM